MLRGIWLGTTSQHNQARDITSLYSHGNSNGAAVFHSCSGPQVCSPPRSLLPRRTVLWADTGRVCLRVRCAFSTPFVVALSPTPIALSRSNPNTPGSRGFSIRAPHGSLPPRAPDMLAVRIGQLTAEDFHLLRFAALSAAPDNKEFTSTALFGVWCNDWLGVLSRDNDAMAESGQKRNA